MPTELHMAQLQVQTRRLLAVARDRGWPLRELDDLGYLLHAELRALFGDDAPQPFRMIGDRGGWTDVLGYTMTDAVALRRRAAELAPPAALGGCRLDELATKPMVPSLFAPGRRFGFEVRTCPVVRLASESALTLRTGEERRYAKGKEVDAYVHAVHLRDQADSRDRETVYVEWLRERLGDAGVALEDARLRAFRRVRVLRRTQERAHEGREARTSQRPDALLEGTLRVDDGARFRALLARGVGRHRAFGFGMLLLRPPES